LQSKMSRCMACLEGAGLPKKSPFRAFIVGCSWLFVIKRLIGKGG
jgi:hypothetical protein